MKQLLHPKVIIPAILSAALIGALLAFAGAPKVVRLIARLDPLMLLIFLGVMVVYNAIRAAQWLILLRRLDLEVGLRSRIFSYLGGAVSMYLPGGSYFQNYLLYQTRDADPAQTSAATTVMTLTEPLMAMLIVALVGIGHWSWLRWLIGISVPVVAGGLIGIFWWVKVRGLPDWLEHRRLVRRRRDDIRKFVNSLAQFRHPLTLVAQALVAALYLVVGGVGLFVVERMLHLHSPSITACIAAYCFALALAMFVPLFTNLGSLEVGGVLALTAGGASNEGAVAMMIFDRALMIAAVFLFLVVAGLAWRDLVGNALQRRKEPATAAASGAA